MLKGISFKSTGKNGFINKYWGKCAATWREVKLDPYLTPSKKINSRHIKIAATIIVYSARFPPRKKKCIHPREENIFRVIGVG